MLTLSTTHHVSFTISDMNRSIEFYRDLFGLTVVVDWVTEADYLAMITTFPGVQLRIAFLELPDTAVRLELIQYLRPAAAGRAVPSNVPGAAHLCFDVTDIHGWHRRLVEAGVQVRSEPVLITSQANYGAYGFYFEDPDGFTLELRQPPQR